MSEGSQGPHLWEVEHPYYCSESNYFAAGMYTRYGSWAEFAEAEDNDFDLNLVFRWDWRPKGEDWDDPQWSDDPYYRDGELWVFWMSQRKGIFRVTVVDVCFADEPEVRKWLEARWEHMKKLWAPFSGSPGGEARLERIGREVLEGGS